MRPEPFLAFALVAALAACSAPSGNAADNEAGNEAAANAAVPADVATELARYLPAPGSHPARAMRLLISPDYERLSARMLAAIGRDRAWFELMPGSIRTCAGRCPGINASGSARPNIAG